MPSILAEVKQLATQVKKSKAAIAKTEEKLKALKKKETTHEERLGKAEARAAAMSRHGGRRTRKHGKASRHTRRR